MAEEGHNFGRAKENGDWIKLTNSVAVSDK